jgi:hypothetical protein
MHLERHVTMRKLIVHQFISLDGVIQVPGGCVTLRYAPEYFD